MNNKTKKIFMDIILVVCIVSFLLSAVFLLEYYLIVPTGEKKVYEELRVENLKLEELIEAETPISQLKPDYSEALKINDETVGWVRISGTEIDYPVVQHPDDANLDADNYYYLNHNFKRKRSVGGAVFLDYRNDSANLDTNTVLWGHNVYHKQNKEPIFSDLVNYENVEFYKKHPIIEFNTLENYYQWKICAVFVTNQESKDDNGYVFNFFYPFLDGENFNGYVDEINKRTLYNTGVDIVEGDKFITLVTCYRGLDLPDYRAPSYIVVVARQVRENEEINVDVENVAINDNPKYPQLYYDKYGLTNPYIDDEKWYPTEV